MKRKKYETPSRHQAMVEDSHETPTPPAHADLSSTVEMLQKQVSRLEAQLKRSEDKNLALNTMIDIAEAQGIRIRKNYMTCTKL